jgi:hypothetical protein
VQLMHWLVQQTRVGICHNERTLSTQSNSCFGAFRTSQVRATKSHRNFSQRTHPIYPIGPQTHVFGCFGPFRYFTNFGKKTCRIGSINTQVRAPRSRRNFSQQTHPIHLIGLKLKFCGVSNYFVTAPTSVKNRPN